MKWIIILLILSFILLSGCDEEPSPIAPVKSEPSIFGLLDQEGLALTCARYSTRKVPAFNLTCKNPTFCFSIPCDPQSTTENEIKKELGCSWGTLLEYKPIVIEENIECIEFKIVRQ